MKPLKTFFLALLVLLSTAALARTPVPLIKLVEQPAAAASGQALAVEQLQQLVRKVAESKKWVVTIQPEGQLIASLSWNNDKHTIVVAIDCGSDRYSIVYKDSINMNYATTGGQAVIHPYYNRFVGELNDAIRVELTRL